MNHGLVDPEDEVYVTNRLLELFQLTEHEGTAKEVRSERELSQILNDMLEYELPNLGGTLVMSDSENGDFVYFDMSNKSIRNKYLSEQNKIMEDKLNFLKKNSIEKILKKLIINLTLYLNLKDIKKLWDLKFL